MAWSNPRTWVAAETVSHDEFNQQIRDNMLVLKTPIADTGKISGLTSTTLADLSGLNLTGVAKVASGNDFTGGKHSFNAGSAARLIAPVGVGKYDGSPGNKTSGSVWVDTDNYLHWVDAQSPGREWRYLGAAGHSDAAALAGSLWVEASDVRYVDPSNVARTVTGTAGHSDAAAIGGSLWADTAYLGWVVETGTQAYLGHVDTHSDAGHVDSHSDTAHTDSHSDAVHGDSHADHSDVGHSDAHGDVAHADSHSDSAHVDSHSDAGHSDSHTDVPELIGT